MTEEKLDMDILQDHYEPALSAFMNRIVEKHGEYGTSFLERSYDWMRRRARGEVIEYYKADGNELSAIEALDVAICWFLVAQKHLSGQKELVDKNPTPEQLRKLYWNDGLSAWIIGDKFDLSETHILRLMKKANIPRRTSSEAISLRYKKKGESSKIDWD